MTIIFHVHDSPCHVAAGCLASVIWTPQVSLRLRRLLLPLAIRDCFLPKRGAAGLRSFDMPPIATLRRGDLEQAAIELPDLAMFPGLNLVLEFLNIDFAAHRLTVSLECLDTSGPLSYPAINPPGDEPSPKPRRDKAALNAAYGRFGEAPTPAAPSGPRCRCGELLSHEKHHWGLCPTPRPADPYRAFGRRPQ